MVVEHVEVESKDIADEMFGRAWSTPWHNYKWFLHSEPDMKKIVSREFLISNSQLRFLEKTEYFDFIWLNKIFNFIRF